MKSLISVKTIAVVALVGILSTIAYTYNSGVSGYTRKNGTAGCGCHGGSYYNTNVLVQITGPDTLQPGQTGNYTVRVSGGPSTKAGIDIAASSGTLAAVSTYLKTMNGELTHNSGVTYVSGGVDFNFKYTAPAVAGTQTLYATGSSKKYWNFAPDKTIVIAENNPVLQITVSISLGWNLLSVPLSAPSMTASALFPSANSPFYSYQNGYSTVTNLAAGKGYWARFPAASDIIISGTAVTNQNVSVTAGWNLIGPFRNAVQAAEITSIPVGIITSSFYGYSNGYLVAATLQPGKAYWVRVSQDGVLVIP